MTEFTGARVGAFSATKMSEAGEWQDPRTKPNVIFYRLNRALVTPRKTVLQRLLGFTYYDGVIRNAFGIPTEQLLRTLKDWQRQALEAGGPADPAYARAALRILSSRRVSNGLARRSTKCCRPASSHASTSFSVRTLTFAVRSISRGSRPISRQ